MKSIINFIFCCKQDESDLNKSRINKRRNSRESTKTKSLSKKRNSKIEILEVIDLDKEDYNAKERDHRSRIQVDENNWKSQPISRTEEATESRESKSSSISNILETSTGNKQHKIFYQNYLHKNFWQFLDDEIIDPKYIRKQELDQLKFTRRGIIKFIESFLDMEDFQKFYDKNNLLLYTRKSV